MNQWDSDGQRIIMKLNAYSVTVYEFEHDVDIIHTQIFQIHHY